MKKLLIIFNILFLASSSVSFAQHADSSFAPSGAEWWHNGEFYPTWGEDNMEYAFVSGDTVINGANCQIIDQKHYRKSNYMNIFSLSVYQDSTLYLHKNGDTVFIFNSNFQRFTPLYIFNVDEGDTVCLPVIGNDLRPNPYAGGDTCFCFVVDSVRTVLYDNTYLKTVFEHSLADSTQTGINFPVYNWSPSLSGGHLPRGAYARKVGGLFGGLLPTKATRGVEKPTSDTLNDFSGYGLRCYEEPGEQGIKIHIAWLYNEDCMFDTTTAIGNLNVLENLACLYPNPVQAELHLSFNVPTTSEAHLIITDALGRTVQELNLRKGTNRKTIDLKGYAPGMYYLNLWQEGQHYAQKFVISSASF